MVYMSNSLAFTTASSNIRYHISFDAKALFAVLPSGVSSVLWASDYMRQASTDSGLLHTTASVYMNAVNVAFRRKKFVLVSRGILLNILLLVLVKFDHVVQEVVQKVVILSTRYSGTRRIELSATRAPLSRVASTSREHDSDVWRADVMASIPPLFRQQGDPDT